MTQASQPRPAPPPQDEQPTVVTVRCQGCKTVVPAQEARSSLGLVLCARCAGVLADGLQSIAQREQEEPPPGPEPPIAEQVEIDHSLIACAGCGREVPVRGTHERDGKRLCPDCNARAVSGEPARPGPRIGVTVSAGPAATPAAGSCMSCGRAAPLRPAGGFQICEACLSTDPEMAIDIARTRHKKRMEELRKQLGD